MPSGARLAYLGARDRPTRALDHEVVMSDYDLPDLPSDEELGIAGLSEEDFADDDYAEAPPSGTKPAEPVGPPPPPPGDTPPPKAAKEPMPEPKRPVPGWRGPLTLVALLVLVWLSMPARTMPPTRAANAPDHLFSSARAMTELIDIARAPHPPGSPEHTRVRGLLLERLRSLGLDPEVQTTTFLRESGDQATGATVRNIVARVPGTASTGAIVLTAHYDSRTFSPGAGDDGVGVVTILETLRALQTGPALDNDLIVLITDAEELGLLGARAFVERHPWMPDVRMVISIEMRGAGGPSIMFETNADNGWIIERLDAADPAPMANSLSMAIYERMPNDTDFTPFKQRGIQGLNFAAIGRAHVYHQASDTPENLDEGTLQHHGERVLAMVRDLGAQDLSSVDAPPRVFFTLPFIGLISYPQSWVLGLTGLLAVVLLAVGGVTVLRGGSWRGMLAGAGLGLLAMGLTAAAGQGLLVWARGRHPEFGSLHGSGFHVEGWYVVALAALALALSTLALSVVRRRVHRGALFFGALLPGTLLALAVGFIAPAAAHALQGPALFALLAVAVVSLAGPRRDTGWVSWAIGLLIALPVLGFMLPVLELVWVAMSFRLAAILGAMMVVLLLFLAPALDGLSAPNRWWLPTAATLGAVLFAALGARTAGSSPDRPAPSTLVYLQDQGGPGAPVRALWVSRPDAGLDWARETTASPLDREETLEGLRLGPGDWLVGDAPAVTLPTPRALIVSDSVSGGRRRLELSVRPGVASEGIGFTVAPPARLVRLGDAELGSASGGLSSVWSEGLPLNDSTWQVTVVQDAALGTLDLEILQHHQRPWELLGDERWARPAELAPNVMNRSDRAIIRSQLRLLLDGSAEATGDAGAEGSAVTAPPLPDPGAAATDTASTSGLTGALVNDTVASPAAATDSVVPAAALPDTTAPAVDTLSAPMYRR